jgi:hypothetical protein
MTVVPHLGLRTTPRALLWPRFGFERRGRPLEAGRQDRAWLKLMAQNQIYLVLRTRRRQMDAKTNTAPWKPWRVAGGYTQSGCGGKVRPAISRFARCWCRAR